MPGSVVAAAPVDAGTPAETTHLNGHCSADVEAKASPTCGEPHDAAGAGENGKQGPCGATTPGDHASAAEENGHAPGCPAQALEEAAANADGDGNDSDRGAGRDADGAGGDGVPDDKDATPETTPAGSDGARGSPSCQTGEAHSKDAGSESATPASAPNLHSHSEAESCNAGTSTANSDAPVDTAADSASGGKKPEERDDDAANTATPADDRPSGEGDKPDDRPPADKDKDVTGTQAAVDDKGVHATAAPAAAAQSKPGDEMMKDDEQLVASLIAVAHNTPHENEDADMADADRARSAVHAFALSDVGTPSARIPGQEPSAEDKQVMATLMKLAAAVQKPGDVTGSENGDDDDDAASGQGSSVRPDADSDGDDMDEDAKASGKDTKPKGPGKRGPKKKKDREGSDGKTDADDKDDDAENDAENSDAAKSARKSKKDAEGDESKPKGRKGKKQVNLVLDVRVLPVAGLCVVK